MGLLNELMRRVAEHSRGMYGRGTGLDRVSTWARPPAVRAWRAWAEADGAFGRGDAGEAGRWLNLAEELAPEPVDGLLRAELALLWARILDRADEPRRAMPLAKEAWKRWFALARNAFQALDGDGLPNLLEALTYPATLQVPRPQLFMEWLADRAAPNLHHAARQVFASCRGVSDAEPALALTRELREWYRSTSEAGGIPPERFAPLLSSLLRDLGNLQDALGDPRAGLERFLEARSMLDAGASADSAEVRALGFDIANQEAKLGRHAEAIQAFGETARAFADAGEEEPALRARHAALVSRFALGESPREILSPLEDVLREYERLLAEGGEWRQEDALRQNLGTGNRLWLSVASRMLGDGVSPERFLAQAFASRSGNARAHTLWQRAMRERSGAAVLDQTSVLEARLAEDEPGMLVLALESGVDEAIAVTLVSGHMPLSERVAVERFSPACMAALETAILRRREAVLAIAAGALSAAAAPDPAFTGAYTALWQALPPRTRERLEAAGSVYFLPEPVGALDETPLELVHDGRGYLGLRKRISRVATWEQMARVLAPNHVDRLARGRFGVVRGADVPALGELPSANEEVAAVQARAREAFAHVEELLEPTGAAFAELLDRGLDVLHFTGHSHADDAGEHLVLRDDAAVGAPELGAARPHPAPVSVFSSCLVGLHRPTRTGLARGIAGALLDAGSPGVVAAMVPLPDEVGKDFALALHLRLRTQPLGEAVRAARVTLAKRFHPATWGCFALFGRDTARVPEPDAPAPPRWPALLGRCLATRGTAHREALEASLARDAGLPATFTARILELVACHAAARRGAPVPEMDERFVATLPADARIAVAAAQALARASCAEDEERAREELAGVLLMQEISDDSYLLVAAVDAGIRSGALLVQDGSSTRLVERATRLLGWLDRSAAGLAAAGEALARVRTRWSETLTFQAHEVAGVTPETFQAADAGDRDAMKKMLWNLKVREASHQALAGHEPWTYWMYRWIGSDENGAMADFCGVVEAYANDRRLTAAQAQALRDLFERFVGPGEIEPEYVQAALARFEGRPAEAAAIRQLELYDRITSGEREVSTTEIEHGRAAAARAGARGLEAFLTLLLAERELGLGDVAAARSGADRALKTFIELCLEDGAYTRRANTGAAFLYNVARASGDRAYEARVLESHRARIEAYVADRE